MPWWTIPPVILSICERDISSIGMPALPAIEIASVIRSSLSLPSAMYSAVAGTFARSASTTGLRPLTVSGASGVALREMPEAFAIPRLGAAPPLRTGVLRERLEAPLSARLAAAAAARAFG
jgi:hypothetical protein